MAKFIYLYKGEATDMADMTPEQSQEEMAMWGAWMEGIGAAMIDMGAPFGAGTTVVDDGSAGTTGQLTGYSIVEAENLDAAKALSAGHPYIREGKGNYAIDVFELIDMSGM